MYICIYATHQLRQRSGIIRYNWSILKHLQLLSLIIFNKGICPCAGTFINQLFVKSVGYMSNSYLQYSRGCRVNKTYFDFSALTSSWPK